MAKTLLLLLGLGLTAWLYKTKAPEKNFSPGVVHERIDVPAEDRSLKKLNQKAIHLRNYAAKNNFSEKTAFLIDMSMPSGRKRFFVYDFEKDSVTLSGLVAHGSCNAAFLETASFSNQTGGGCSSLGKYKVAYAYQGNFGRAFKLKGLDASNSRAFERFVVLHSYECVPDEETSDPICNSRGCPMVSPMFLQKLARIIDNADKPLLLYIFN